MRTRVCYFGPVLHVRVCAILAQCCTLRTESMVSAAKKYGSMAPRSTPGATGGGLRATGARFRHVDR